MRAIEGKSARERVMVNGDRELFGEIECNARDGFTVCFFYKMVGF